MNSKAIRPVYYDCDTGVDDAMGLAYLMLSPEIQLVGVGTVSGNTDARQAAENSLRLMGLAGRADIPVAIGEEHFLTSRYAGGPAHIHGANGIGNVDLPEVDLQPVAESAPEMIVRLAKEYEGRLEIISVGPLTNLARALQLDPELARRVKQVTSMGGAALVPGNVSPVGEANVWDDPEAAAMVVKADWPVTLVGLDVTMENILEESHRAQLLASDQPLARAIGQILDLYFDFYRTVYGRRCSALHDPLAVAIGVGNITPVNSPWVDVAIDATDGPGRGQTIADLRGQRLGPVDHPGAHTRMVLDTDRKLPDHLVERLTSRPGTTMQPGSRVVAAQGTVVVVGSINADLSVEVARHPMPGETVPGRDASMGPGGKGANQAVAAALLGGAVTMVGAVGEDSNAQVALERIATSGLDHSHVRRVPGPTGLAIVVVADDGENSIIVVPGANGQVDSSFVDEAADVIRSADVVVVQGEIPESGTVRAAELATGRFVLNHAPVTPLPGEVIRQADPLVVNEHEGALVLAMLHPDLAGLPDMSHAEVAQALVAAGVPSVVMTLGSHGSLIVAPDSQLTAVPSARVTAVDSTGAGDAFVGALVLRLAAGESLVDAARFASRVGAFACTRPGAQASYPGVDDELPPLP